MNPASPRTGRGRRIARLGVLGTLGLLLASCASGAQQSTLEPEGPAAESIMDLSNLTFGIAGVVFVLVQAAVLFIVWKYRAGKDDTGDPADFPAQVHGNTKLEIGWTMLPAVILAFLAVFTVSTIFDLAEEPEDALNVRVVGQQWWWAYDYDMDGDGVFADDDLLNDGYEHPEEFATDIETATDLYIPAGQPVYLTMSSRDVIHSYWIPALNGKKDTVPGRFHNLTIEADEPGTYVGQCTEYCGLSHAYMRMNVVALDEDDWDAWVENQLELAATPTDPQALAGLEVFEARCASCHVVEGVNSEDYQGAAQVSGAAPNLTHFAARANYAGGIFQLWKDQDGDGIVQFDEIGVELDRNQLEAWLRNSPAEKPMYPQGERGMPNLGLSEGEIDSLVAYLLTLD